MEILQVMDENIVLWVREIMSCEILDWAMKWISVIGNGGAIFIALAIVLIFLPDKNGKNLRAWGITLLICLGVTAIFANVMIKPYVARIRPFEELGLSILIKAPHDFSFPSGHTAAAFASAVVIYSMRRKTGVLMFFFAFLMAFSRIYLAVHYPTDIIAGAILGFSSSYAVLKVLKNFGVGWL